MRSIPQIQRENAVNFVTALRIQKDESNPCIPCEGTGYIPSGFDNLRHKCTLCDWGRVPKKYARIDCDCPECGSEMEAPIKFCDGEAAVCADCGFRAGVSVDENGNYWLQEQ